MPFQIPDNTCSLRDSTTYATPILHVHSLLLQHDTDEHKAAYSHKGRWLGGFAIPNFQRPLVWEEERQIKFIESAWLGICLGVYVVNQVDQMIKGKYHPLHDTLVDGQQRLQAFSRYFHDEFTVFGSIWSEVPKIEQRGFLMTTHFPHLVIHITDESRLRDIYNRLAFGGIAHTEDQKA